MNVTLYSIGCMRCKQLEKNLESNGIGYELVDDKEVMLAKDFSQLPMLEVDGDCMEYAQAMEWVNTYVKNN